MPGQNGHGGARRHAGRPPGSVRAAADRKALALAASEYTMEALDTLVTDGVITLVSSTLTLLGVVLILLFLDFQLALVTFATFPILAIGSVIFRIASAGAYRRTREKIANITDNIGVTYSGMGPDNRVLLRGARKAAQKYYLQYKDPIPCAQLVKEVASVAQEFTQRGGVRPFGVSLLIAGYDSDGPQLYQVDPSGSYWAWKASAIGKNATNAKTFLEKRYLAAQDMELEDAINTAILTLKEGFDGAMNEHNIEIGVISKDKPTFTVLSPERVAEYLAEVE